MIVPASSEEKVQFGVESIVGDVTTVTPAITGAVVSVVDSSSSSLQEMTVRLIMDIRIICIILFIFTLYK